MKKTAKVNKEIREKEKTLIGIARKDLKEGDTITLFRLDYGWNSKEVNISEGFSEQLDKKYGITND